MKITELKIVIGLILLMIIMIAIAYNDFGVSKPTEETESKVIVIEPEIKQDDNDESEITVPIIEEEPIIEETETESFEEMISQPETEYQTQIESQPQEEILIGSDEFGYDNALMLHKIAIAEAGGESVESMAIIINVILNRVMNENFPNSIREVIFEKTMGVAQFTPTVDGNYNKAQPNDKSYQAMLLVLGGLDESRGALYFETCEYGSVWHSTALEFIFEKDGIRYYK